MQINFHGHACFSIKDGDTVVVTDPYDESTGLKLPNLEANVVTVSHKHPCHSNVTAVQGEPRVFSWPGEYETAGIYFSGISSF
ncbi:MBL fold metallo-hydrolase, partial [Candidatus Saccharibacteria bacterium]|nr:MBL fold metallo-hydrolase [Fodinibius sp.]NIV71927.1 MBL fold metallo-hydrolase [Calditrichia bacterium]NIV98698.1 MBL fold metallo-hydrolase [Candidatus Saccharibacteria bacterium]